jgi:hypothetical protein
MRVRFYLFAAIVLIALAAHLGLLTARVSQGAEDAMRSRLSTASAAVRMQIALLDAGLTVRAAVQSPSLADATRPGPDGKPVRPDERALLAVASAIEPEPELIIVGGPLATAVSRHGKGANLGDDAAAQDLVKGAVEGPSAARFATYDGKLYRIASARVPGADSAVVVGQAIDDRFATQLRSQVDADVTVLAGGKVVASSLTPEGRAAVARWVRSPSPGYGTLTVRLPLVDASLSGKLPLGTPHLATRAALVNFPDTGAQAVVSVSAAPSLSWLGRYQAFYLAALALFLIGAIVWGLVLAPKVAATRPAPAPRLHPSPPVPVGSRSDASARSRALLGADVSAPSETVKPAPAPTEVPWSAGGEEDGVVSGPTPVRKLDTPLFDPFPASSGAAAAAAADEPAVGPLPAGPEGGWSVGEPREMEVEAGPASLGPEPIAGEPIAALPHPPIAGEEQREQDLAFAQSAETEPAVPLPGAGPQKADHLLHSPEVTPYPGDEPTRVEPLSAMLIDRMRERDEGEAPLAQKAPDRPAGMGTGWEDPAVAAATPDPAWGGAAEAGSQEPAAAPWSETVSTLPEGAPTPPWNEPVPLPTPAGTEGSEAASGSAEAEAAQGEQAFPEAPAEASPEELHLTEVTGVQTPLEGEPLPAGETAEQPPAQEQQEPMAEAAPEEPAGPGMEDLAAPEEGDPDEAHFQETFERFLELRQQTGEPGNVSYERFAVKLRRNREDLMARHNAKGVRFSVYLKDGRAAIKASALR